MLSFEVRLLGLYGAKQVRADYPNFGLLVPQGWVQELRANRSSLIFPGRGHNRGAHVGGRVGIYYARHQTQKGLSFALAL